MADLPLAEIEWRIALLPPVSRGVHLGGPAFHAQRLVELWKVDDGDDVPLAQAFRLLDVAAMEGAVWRAATAKEDFGDSHHWAFPSFEGLLPELRMLLWQDMLAGTLVTTAIKGVRGKQHRTVLPAELARLAPNWELSRLCRGTNDEFVDVRVGRAPAKPINWRQAPPKADIKAAMQDIERTYRPGAQPPFADILDAFRARWPDFPRDDAREALREHAPRLLGQRGRRSTKSRS